MIIKSAMAAVLASAMGLSVAGCLSAEAAAENVDETAEALTTGITFDPTSLYLSYAVNGVYGVENAHYYPNQSSVTFNVPCDATQVGIQVDIKYNDTGAQLWPAVTATVPGLPSGTSNLNPMLQGTTATFGQWSNRTTNPLTGAASDQTLGVTLTLKTYTDSGYTTLSSAPATTITYYVRRLCTCL